MDGWIYMDVTDFTNQLVDQMFKTKVVNLPKETMCLNILFRCPKTSAEWVTIQHICSFAKKQPTFTRPTPCVCMCGEEAHKLTQFTLSALEPCCAVADEGVTSVHACTPVLAGQTAAVLWQLWKTTAAINIHSTEWVWVSGFRPTTPHYLQLIPCVDSL